MVHTLQRDHAWDSTSLTGRGSRWHSEDYPVRRPVIMSAESPIEQRLGEYDPRARESRWKPAQGMNGAPPSQR